MDTAGPPDAAKSCALLSVERLGLRDRFLYNVQKYRKILLFPSKGASEVSSEQREVVYRGSAKAVGST